jgi:hypothetical protein
MTMRRLLTAVIATCALAACDGDDGTGPDVDETPASLVGVYRLVTVNGDSLPALLRNDSVQVAVTSGYYNLNADDTFTYGFAYAVTRGGATTTETEAGSGEWGRNNDAVIFFYADEELFPEAGTVSGRHPYMTVILASPYVFRRE